MLPTYPVSRIYCAERLPFEDSGLGILEKLAHLVRRTPSPRHPNGTASRGQKGGPVYESASRLSWRKSAYRLGLIASLCCSGGGLVTESVAMRRLRCFAPLDPDAKPDGKTPKLDGIVFDVDGTLW